MIINITLEYNDKFVEVMFHSLNDWFIVLFPLNINFEDMKSYYIGKDFYDTKKIYKGKVWCENDIFN
jgi:hypothetical protein